MYVDSNNNEVSPKLLKMMLDAMLPPHKATPTPAEATLSSGESRPSCKVVATPISLQTLNSLAMHAKIRLMEMIKVHLIQVVEGKNLEGQVTPALLETYSRLLVWLGTRNFQCKWHNPSQLLCTYIQSLSPSPPTPPLTLIFPSCYHMQCLSPFPSPFSPVLCLFSLTSLLFLPPHSFAFLLPSLTHPPYVLSLSPPPPFPSPPSIAYLIPIVFKSQAWGVLHSLLEIIVFRVHVQLQYSSRFQLLQQLHTVASVSIIPTQLYGSTENAALRLIKGLSGHDFLIQLAKQFATDPKRVSVMNMWVSYDH